MLKISPPFYYSRRKIKDKERYVWVYRKAMTKDEAIDEIMKNSATQFDPEIAKIFIEDILKGDGPPKE